MDEVTSREMEVQDPSKKNICRFRMFSPSPRVEEDFQPSPFKKQPRKRQLFPPSLSQCGLPDQRFCKLPRTIKDADGNIRNEDSVAR